MGTLTTVIFKFS